MLLAYNKDEHIATIKGVDSNFAKVTAVDDSVFVGDYLFYYYYDNLRVQCAVLGAGIASTLMWRSEQVILQYKCLYLAEEFTNFRSTQFFLYKKCAASGHF